MAFAAFGVDLASFYSRASYLQKSADAAALAGTVWMPNLTKARQIACDSLLNNGIDGGDCGTGTFNVTIDPRLHRHLAPRHRHRPRRHPLLLPGLRQRRPGPHPLRRSRVQPPPPPRQPPQLLRRRQRTEPTSRPCPRPLAWPGPTRTTTAAARRWRPLGRPPRPIPAAVATTQVAAGGWMRTRRAPTARPSRPGARASTPPSSARLSNGSNAVPPPDYMTAPPGRELAGLAQPLPGSPGRHGDRHGARILERGHVHERAPVVRATRARGGPRRRTVRPSPRWGPRASRTPGTRRT